jgi:hypothetical protein
MVGMIEDAGVRAQEGPPVDPGDYCRRVEDYLTRVNGGHLVRIVGPGFALVRQWAEEGIPLSVVCRGIDLKTERHRAGRARRPLRIEFCEADVRDVYEGWRRAVGLAGRQPAPEAEAAPRRHPALGRHLDRAADRLGHVGGRLDLPEGVRDAAAAVLAEVAALRETAHGARGAAREAAMVRLGLLDRQFLSAVRAAAPHELVESMTADAERDLAPYRGRLTAEAWQRAVDVSVERLIRDRYGLPTLDL